MANDYKPRQRPEPPGFWAYPADVHQFKADRELYDKEQMLRMTQELNPLRDMNLGQVSRLTEMPMKDIASPDQYGETKYGTAGTGVPHWSNFVPTMSNEPQVQPPHVATGLARPASPPQPAGSPLQPGQAPSASAGINPQTAPQYTYGTESREPAPEAKSNLYQQMLAESEIKQRGYPLRYNPNAQPGSAGVNTLREREQMIYDAHRLDGKPHEEAAMLAKIQAARGMTGDQYQANLENTQARTNQTTTNTMLAPGNAYERQRHNLAMEARANRATAIQERLAEMRRDAIDKGDALGYAKLGEAERWHNLVSSVVMAQNKTGVFSKEEEDAAHKAFDIISGFTEREPTPEELTWLEKFTGTKAPRYNWKQPTPDRRGQGTPSGQKSTTTIKSAGASTKQSTTGGPVSIQSDDEYNKLKSGTAFVGPDGVPRVKP